ncbi:MAG: Omp28-related outer membrane protein [Bacteroidetes bacterium]|nr:Omp28-related outer membrane protein [Bacteroidota bacterium]
MKKLLVLATIVSLALFSCKDKGGDGDGTDDGSGKAPETYTSKVLLEYTTCAKCPYCPDGPIYADKLVTSYGADVVYSVAMHNTYQGNDAMVTTESQSFSDAYSAGNPTGMINRIGGKCESRSNWSGKAAGVTGEDAKCGLAIDASKKNGAVYTVKVKVGVGKNDLPAGKYYVIAYLSQKEMTGSGDGWDQSNGYNTTSTHVLYNKGNPLKNYIHHNVFRKSLNTMNGTLIASDKMKAGSISEYSFDLDMAGLDAAGHDITAFVYFKSVSAPYVENVQRVALGSNKNFD